MRRDAPIRALAVVVLAVCVCALPQTVTAQTPGDITPVPSGPAVPLAEMQARCDASAVGRTAGVRRDDAFNPGVAGAAAVLAKIRPIFAGFAPNGFETRTGGTVFTPEYGMPAYMRPWNFHVLSYPYSCLSNGRFSQDTHYAFSAYVTINNGLDHGPYRLPLDYNPDSRNGDGTGEDSTFGFYTLRDEWLVDGLPQAKNGYFHIRGEYADSYWFTRGGQLPFAYVSREEFLRKQTGILQTGLAHTRSEMTSAYTAAGQPVDHATINTILAAMYERPIARYQQLLTQPAPWLQQPAIVRMSTSAEEASYEFLEASHIGFGAQVPIKPHPGYFDASTPAGAPQYLVIRLGNQHKRGEYDQLRDLIERNVETFKSLVD